MIRFYRSHKKVPRPQPPVEDLSACPPPDPWKHAHGMKSIRWITLFLTSAFAAVAASPLTPVTFQLDWKFNVQFAGILTAHAHGWYREAGLDVTLLPVDADNKVLERVVAGTNWVGCIDGGVLVAARAQGMPVRAFGTMLQGTPNGLLSLKSRGFTQPSQLRGKRIGVHADGNRAIDLVLAAQGLKSTDVSLVPSEHDVSPLIRGDLDFLQGYLIDEAVELEARGHPVNFLPYDEFGFPGYSQVYVATESMLRSNPGLVRRILDVSNRGWREVLRDPAAAVQLVVSRYSPDYDPVQQRASLTRLLPLLTRESGHDGLGSMRSSTWQAMVDSYSRAGFASGPLSASDLVATSLPPSTPIPLIAQVRPPVPLTFQLDWKPNAQFAGLLLAQEKGWFREAGLDLTFLPVDGAMKMVERVVAGTNWLGCAESGVLLAARARGAPIRAFATMLQGSPMSLISKKSSAITQPSHLIGRKLGIHPDGQQALDILLQHSGLRRDQMTVLEKPHDLSPLLTDECDAVQGYLIDEAVALETRGVPVNILPFHRHGYAAYSQVYFTSETFLAQHPQLIETFLKVANRGWRAAAQDIPGTAQLVVHRFAPLLGLPYQEKSLEKVIELMRLETGPGGEGRMKRETWDRAMSAFNAASKLPLKTDDLVDFRISDKLATIQPRP